MTQPVFRFAPSPNGRLHLGHAFSALLNQRLARETGGRLLLRVENTDTVRCLPMLERRMLEDLAWLGIEWDEEPRRQSEHGADYQQALDRLGAMGLVYPGFFSRGAARQAVETATARGRSWPVDPDGVPHYPPEDRDLAEAERQSRLDARAPHTLRLDMEAALDRLSRQDALPLTWQEEGGGPEGETGEIAADPGQWGDFMLTGRDRSAAYHLACAVDDAAQGISHVVRGRDLFLATSAQRLLQELLGLPQPTYLHHDLILDSDGRKLSKSRSDTSLAELRMAGATPGDIRKMVGL
ncbi:MAG: tRNA glutamyl-Q(34) synthetase GluQRS [Nitratireductor sp.]|nr:tRNA glutamyl-Q(34) synthetase GluQRS [Nitratireductor sp.]